jgi:DNA-directed RNA polymerase specialized sigma54-like protein
MIQAMQVLQLPLLELKDQIDQELQENVFLERKDEASAPRPPGRGPSRRARRRSPAARVLAEIDQLEARLEPNWRLRQGSYGGDEEDKKLEALNNTPAGRPRCPST